MGTRTMGSSRKGREAEWCRGIGDDAIIPQCQECNDVLRWGHNHNVIGASTGTRCASLQHRVAAHGSANCLQHMGLGGQCYNATQTVDTRAPSAGSCHVA